MPIHHRELPSPAELYQQFLRWYDGHKVLTLSALNALSLFIIASFLFLVAPSRMESAHAQAALRKEEPAPTQAQRPEAPPRQHEAPDSPEVEPPGTPTRRLRAQAPPAARRNDVEIRRVLRVRQLDPLEVPPPPPIQELDDRAELLFEHDSREEEEAYYGSP